jgi:hypothetical protein
MSDILSAAKFEKVSPTRRHGLWTHRYPFPKARRETPPA